MGTPVTSERVTMYVEDVAYKKSISEAIMTKFAKAINFIMDRIYYNERIVYHGYFSNSTFDSLATQIFIPTRCEIAYWTMSVMSTRSAGNNSMNFTVYDENGTSLGDLFSTAPVINQASISRALVGKDKDGNNINQNTTSGFTNGTLALTELQANYTLVPKITANSTRAFGMVFNLGLRPLE